MGPAKKSKTATPESAKSVSSDATSSSSKKKKKKKSKKATEGATINGKSANRTPSPSNHKLRKLTSKKFGKFLKKQTGGSGGVSFKKLSEAFSAKFADIKPGMLEEQLILHDKTCFVSLRSPE